MTLETWISRHPYLRPLAEFHARLSEATATIPFRCVTAPNWDDYAGDYQRGLPLLKSTLGAVDSVELERIISLSLQKYASIALPPNIKEKSMELYTEFHAGSGRSQKMVAWLLGNDDCTSANLGLFRLTGWTALAQYLGPLIAVFERWRCEESWMRCYCPVCGSGPSMAQLAGIDPGRRRLLVCGYCRTRWQFLRIGCPFCGNVDDQLLSVLSVEGEKQLRIDHCMSCSGYLKTYNGDGQENLMLADWTSLQLDFLAKDRGLKRLATSLYEL